MVLRPASHDAGAKVPPRRLKASPKAAVGLERGTVMRGGALEGRERFVGATLAAGAAPACREPSATRRRALRVAGIPVQAASARSATWASAPLLRRSAKKASPAVRESQVSVTSMPPFASAGSHPQRTRAPPTQNANAFPGLGRHDLARGLPGAAGHLVAAGEPRAHLGRGVLVPPASRAHRAPLAHGGDVADHGVGLVGGGRAMTRHQAQARPFRAGSASPVSVATPGPPG